MTAKEAKVSKTRRSGDYPDPIVSGEPVKLFYECFSRWSESEAALEMQQSKEEILNRGNYYSYQREFIEEGKAHFSNNDFSKGNIIKLLGGQLHWRKSLQPIAILIDCYEHITEDKAGFCPLIPLSCRNSFLLNNIGERDSAWRVINNAMKIGLITCVDDTFWFPFHDKDHPLNGRKGKCRMYAWNKTAQKELKKLAKAEGLIQAPKSIGLDKLCRAIDEEEERKISGTPLTERERILLEKVRVDTNLNIPKGYTDEEVCEAVIRKYPLIAETIKLVKEVINPLIDRPEQKFMANIKVTRSKSGRITKIGFRPASHYVSLKKDETALHENHGMKSRRQYLDDHFGKNQWKEWDVKSSVPRLQYALNHDLDWLPCSQVDMYERLATDEIKQDPLKWKKVYRDQLKKLFLRVNFNYSYKTIFEQLRRNGALSEFIPATSIEMAKAVVRGIKERMTSTLGPTCGSEIFILESYLYLKTYAKCLKESKQKNLPAPLLFYDGFVSHVSQAFDFEGNIVDELRKLKSNGMLIQFFNNKKHGNQSSIGTTRKHPAGFLVVTNMSGYGKTGGFLMVCEPPEPGKMNTKEGQRGPPMARCGPLTGLNVKRSPLLVAE